MVLADEPMIRSRWFTLKDGRKVLLSFHAAHNRGEGYSNDGPEYDVDIDGKRVVSNRPVGYGMWSVDTVESAVRNEYDKAA